VSSARGYTQSIHNTHMADAPAMAAGMTGAEAPDGPGGAGAGGAAAEEQMMGPPLDEPGFPSLPMFKGELNEWINATTPQRLAMVSLGLREGLGLSGMGMLADDGNGMLQSGLTYGTRFGALKAEVVSQGVLQTTLEGFMPLPFLQLTTQLAFMPQGLAGGAMQSVLMSPIGAIIGSANLGGQLSAELLLPLQPFGEDSQLLLGANAWGLPGAWGGSKFAVEYTQAEPTADGSMPTRIGTVTAEVTRPRAGSPNGVSGSLSACQQLGGGDALNATFEVTPRGERVLSMGGSKQVARGVRLRGRTASNGLLALALQMEREAAQLTVAAEVDTTPAGRPPRFGATLMFNR